MQALKRLRVSIVTQLQSWRHSFIKWWNSAPANQPTIFHSARLKLTGFYLAVLLVFSLSLTITIRAIAEYQFVNEGTHEQGIVRRLLSDQFSVPPQPISAFKHYQNDEDTVVHRRLNEYLIIINLGALILGGWLSYWYAGRTLKPIEEAHEEQARFAADASHELRTPLANMKLENEVFLRQRHFSDTEARNLISSNLEEVQRLENLARNLLMLTTYEHQALYLEPLNIKTVVETAVNQLDKIAAAKKIKIQSTVKGNRVQGNFDSLVQLVGIVLDNALKYGPPKSRVYINSDKIGQALLLTIRDEGPGIAPDDLPHIFDRLYRGDKARSSRVGGFGLGLSLAQEIVRANHGEIEATNYPSGGAQLTITLHIATNSKK